MVSSFRFSISMCLWVVLVGVFISKNVYAQRFNGTFGFRNFRGLDCELKVCHVDGGVQGRYTRDGSTIGFLVGEDDGHQVVGDWFEAGGHLGRFEINYEDNLDFSVYLWYKDQNSTDSSPGTYKKYYSHKFDGSRLNDNDVDSINDCWVSDPNNEKDTLEGNYKQGDDVPGDVLYICQDSNSTRISGHIFGTVYFQATSYFRNNIVTGTWNNVDGENEGTMILKWVNNYLVGFFGSGYSNIDPAVQYQLNPNGIPARMSFNESMTPTLSQCVNMDWGGFTGVWTDNLHGRLYLCANSKGDIVGAYNQKVEVNDEELDLPIGVLRGKIDKETFKVQGLWFEAGHDQNGTFVWEMRSDFQSFSGKYWSGEINEGIGVLWDESRISYAVSNIDCLEKFYLPSDDVMNGTWSQIYFPNHIDPATNEPYGKLNLTVCQNETHTLGITHRKGDWQGDDELDSYLGFGSFIENWRPNPLKIGGNTLFRVIHENFSVSYGFEGENNIRAEIGHFRVHTRLEEDNQERNCTPVFIQNSSGSMVVHWMLIIVVIIVAVMSAY